MGGCGTEPPPWRRDGNGERAGGGREAMRRPRTTSIDGRCSVTGDKASRGDGGRRRATASDMVGGRGAGSRRA